MIGAFVSVVRVVKVVIGVKAKCKRSAVDFFNILRSIIINKTNVPADLHELLSTAKNLPELSIRIYLIRLLPISCSKTLTRLTSNFVCHYSLL